jgi:hypothetical protein
MTDDLDHRLHDLLGAVEPAVVISPAAETRGRGERR